MLIDTSQISIDQLNDTYIQIAELIGLEDTIRLSEVLAGKEIVFKKSFDLDYDYQEIIECIGKAKTEMILHTFNGEGYVYFSTIKYQLKKQIHKKIRNEFTGYNYNELATKYGYCTRQLRNIVSSKK